MRKKERRLDEIEVWRGLKSFLEGAELVEYDPTRADNVKIARTIVCNITTSLK